VQHQEGFGALTDKTIAAYRESLPRD